MGLIKKEKALDFHVAAIITNIARVSRVCIRIIRCSVKTTSHLDVCESYVHHSVKLLQHNRQSVNIN